jgi:hypothetical protein
MSFPALMLLIFALSIFFASISVTVDAAQRAANAAEAMRKRLERDDDDERRGYACDWTVPVDSSIWNDCPEGTFTEITTDDKMRERIARSFGRPTQGASGRLSCCLRSRELARRFAIMNAAARADFGSGS